MFLDIFASLTQVIADESETSCNRISKQDKMAFMPYLFLVEQLHSRNSMQAYIYPESFREYLFYWATGCINLAPMLQLSECHSFVEVEATLGLPLSKKARALTQSIPLPKLQHARLVGECTSRQHPFCFLLHARCASLELQRSLSKVISENTIGCGK